MKEYYNIWDVIDKIKSDAEWHEAITLSDQKIIKFVEEFLNDEYVVFYDFSEKEFNAIAMAAYNKGYNL